MTQPLVSVVMSVRNGASFLGEAVDSILGQSLEDFEFIILDDGSTDTTYSILSAYARDRRVQVYRQASLGLVDSLNRGCRLAKGKYIARMDADDVAMRDRLSLQHSFLESNADVGAVGGATEIMNSRGEGLLIQRYPTRDSEIRSELYGDGCPLCHPAVMMRADAFVSAGGYRRLFIDAEDYDLWLRIADRYSLANLEETVLRYRRHPAQISIRKCGQQALSATAARLAALRRQGGQPEGLDDVSELAPAVLERLGANRMVWQTALARGLLNSIQSMAEVGEDSLVREYLGMFESFEWRTTETSVLADFLLFRASLQWRERRFLNSVRSFAKALATRPKIVGRPLKPILTRLSRYKNGSTKHAS